MLLYHFSMFSIVIVYALMFPRNPVSCLICRNWKELCRESFEKYLICRMKINTFRRRMRILCKNSKKCKCNFLSPDLSEIWTLSALWCCCFFSEVESPTKGLTLQHPFFKRAFISGCL